MEFFSLKRANEALENDFIKASEKVIKSGWYINGPEKANFEKQFASFCNQEYAVGVGNGLDAITIALKAYDIGVGDEVIVPAHTFIASWLGIEGTGAKIVPVDVCPSTACIDSDAIEVAITPNTKAILAVNLYGNVCKLDVLRSQCDKHNIKLVIDSAQSHGATFNGFNSCEYADASTYSFYPSKNIGALGDAGAIVSNDLEFITKVKAISNYGSHVKYHHVYKGVNSRLDEIQAAFLNVQLEHAERTIQNRKDVAKKYFDKLCHLAEKGFFQIITPFNPDSVYHLFVLAVKSRDSLLKYLEENDIEALIHYPIAVHKQECYIEQYKDSKFPVTEKLSNEVISLPLSPLLTDNEIDFVCTKLEMYFN